VIPFPDRYYNLSLHIEKLIVIVQKYSSKALNIEIPGPRRLEALTSGDEAPLEPPKRFLLLVGT
jgi:hypothetical protein